MTSQIPDFLLTVLDGLPDSFVELSVGGKTLPILATSPGPNPGEMLYFVQIPVSASTGPSDLFFRNLGATPLTLPALVPEIAGGFDYVPVTVN